MYQKIYEIFYYNIKPKNNFNAYVEIQLFHEMNKKLISYTKGSSHKFVAFISTKY